MVKVIEVELTMIEEKITDILIRKSMTANQLLYYLEGLGWPLSPWQLRQILSSMERLKVITKDRKGHTFRYKYLTLTELSRRS